MNYALGSNKKTRISICKIMTTGYLLAHIRHYMIRYWRSQWTKKCLTWENYMYKFCENAQFSSRYSHSYIYVGCCKHKNTHYISLVTCYRSIYTGHCFMCLTPTNYLYHCLRSQPLICQPLFAALVHDFEYSKNVKHRKKLRNCLTIIDIKHMESSVYFILIEMVKSNPVRYLWITFISMISPNVDISISTSEFACQRLIQRQK